MQTPMTNTELMIAAPSIFAAQPWDRMSARYAFIPTIQVVDKMRSEGFMPVYAAQSKTRIAGKAEFTKHLIRFRDLRYSNAPAIAALGGLYPELILTNSHDGASTYNVNAGVFRAICVNGLMVGDSFGDQMKVRHSRSADDIIEASYKIVDQFPAVLESVEQFSQLRLSAPQQAAYATAALQLRYDDGEAPVQAAQIVRPRRSEDVAPTLFNTFNTVQENLINGGVRGRNPQTNRRVRTRAVSSIGENSKLNKALWTLTEEMRKLAA